MEKRIKLKYRKGDLVYVISGISKDLSKPAKILEVFTDTQRVLVEGRNMVSKHSKPNAQNTQGGIVKKESPIHISNVMLADPKTGKPSRVGRRLEDGKIVRYSKKSGETIKDAK